MLKRKHRLSFRSKPVFKNVLSTPFFTVKYQANSVSNSRFGFVVSKQIDKRSVIRNKIKRFFRSVIEEHAKSLKNNTDLLFILKPKIKDLDKTKMQEEIIKALKSKNLI